MPRGACVPFLMATAPTTHRRCGPAAVTFTRIVVCVVTLLMRGQMCPRQRVVRPCVVHPCVIVVAFSLPLCGRAVRCLVLPHVVTCCHMLPPAATCRRCARHRRYAPGEGNPSCLPCDPLAPGFACPRAGSVVSGVACAVGTYASATEGCVPCDDDKCAHTLIIAVTATLTYAAGVSTCPAAVPLSVAEVGQRVLANFLLRPAPTSVTAAVDTGSVACSVASGVPVHTAVVRVTFTGLNNFTANRPSVRVCARVMAVTSVCVGGIWRWVGGWV
jgi:hypothetical protein